MGEAGLLGIKLWRIKSKTIDTISTRDLQMVDMSKGAFRQPEYLSANDHPSLRIRCPIHGFIHFSENERRLIDHELFRRLRHIRQLALTEYVYPGATHTRFEHSLGVMHIATMAFDELARKNGKVLEAKFRETMDLNRKPLARARQALRLAGLAHDIGHTSFSHAAEKVVGDGMGHETITLKLLESDQFLRREVDSLYWDGCASFVAKIIRGGSTLPPQVQILHDIISGQMDFDRADYLLRDSLHCGVDYGKFDFRRLIECLDFVVDESGTLSIALDRGGLHAFESMILSRYQMHVQVYFHRIRRIYDRYLVEYHKSLGKGFMDTVEKVLAQNDITMMARIFADAERGAGDERKWALRIKNRNHHRMIFESNLSVDAMDLRKIDPIAERLRKRYDDIDFMVDRVNGSIHRMLRRGDSDNTEYASMFLTTGKSRCEIGASSQVLGSVPRDFICVRIYADVPSDKGGLRRELEKFVGVEWKE